VQTSYRNSDYQSDILRKFDFQYCNIAFSITHQNFRTFCLLFFCHLHAQPLTFTHFTRVQSRNRRATARYRAFTLYRTACGSSSSSAIFREKRATGEIPPHRGPCHAHTCVPVGARRTAAAESEKRRARRTGARCGDAIRNVRRFESNRRKIGPGKLTTPAHRRRYRATATVGERQPRN